MMSKSNRIYLFLALLNIAYWLFFFLFMKSFAE